MTIKQQKSVTKALTAAGIAFKPCTMTDGSLAVMAIHDYEGMYPTEEARAAHTEAARIASRRGLYFEARGYMTGTLIR
jgi:hypothetical protein